MFELAILLIFPAAMAMAAVSDLMTMTIPNRLSLVLVLAFAVMALITQMPLVQIGWHVAAGGLMLVITFGFFAAGWIGGGDAKLAASIGLWLGWSQLVEFAALASLLGGLLTLSILAVRSMPTHPMFLLRQDWFIRLTGKEAGIPYGIALAMAALMVYPASFWMTVALY